MGKTFKDQRVKFGLAQREQSAHNRRSRVEKAKWRSLQIVEPSLVQEDVEWPVEDTPEEWLALALEAFERDRRR